MKIVQINATCGKGSTGKICQQISMLLNDNGIENYVLFSEGESDYKNAIKYLNKKSIKIQSLKSHIFGNFGFSSSRATKNIIKHLERIKPDIVHVHNIHGHNCNFKKLFEYLRNKQIKIFYTFHDCWAFTGYCPYFDLANCDKWKTQCDKCVQRKTFSWFFDKSKKLFEMKKKALSDLDLTIITPSQWLKDMAKESFLKDYPIKVINNGIDLDIFKPMQSDFRDRYNLKDKFIVLGVAFDWGRRKGLDVFIELSKRLPNEYQIVLVGTNPEIDKTLPKNIITINRTKTQQQLIEIYSSADVFVNPTREEAFGMVNIEALACGIAGITFNSGGSAECYDSSCGTIIDKEDIDAMQAEIIRICENKPFSKEDCIKRAKLFDKNDKYKEYIDKYLGG